MGGLGHEEDTLVKSGLPILDSDLHLMEPPDMYQRYLDPSYRDRAPMATSSGAGHYAGWVVAGRPVPPWTGNPDVMRANQALDVQAQTLMEEGWATQFDPATTVKAMDAEGIDVAVMFRTSASMIVSIDELDPQYSLALCRAFNDWVADYCREAPSRLKSTAIVPQHDPVLAGQEARRAVEDLQALAIVPLPMPISGNHVHDPGFDVLWQELQRLGVPACFHGTSGALSADYVGGRFAGHPSYRTLLHSSVFPLELMLTLGSMILGGVLERFPRLKVAFLEGNCAWLPWWLYRLDDQWEKFGPGEQVKLSERPSTYFLRQCYVSVESDEHLAEDVVNRLGDDNLVFSTDYPHPDSAYPHATDHFIALEGLSTSTKGKILWDNCARLYGL